MKRPSLPLPRQPWFGRLSICVTVLGLTLGGGGVGLLVGCLVVGSWYLFPAMYAFTVGQFALVAVGPGLRTPVSVGLVEAGLLGILLAPLTHTDTGRGLVVIASSFTGVLIGSWYLTQWLPRLWHAVGVLVSSGALLAYGLHRYEQVALNLVHNISAVDHE